MHLVGPVVLSALLFSVGIYGVLARRNAVAILMAVELMLNAANLNFVAFSAYLSDALLGGQVFALFLIVVAAAEVGVGLAIVLLLFRNRQTVDVDRVRALADADPPEAAESAPAGPAQAAS